MYRSLLTLLLISLPGPASAQVLTGELLLNSFANPDVLVHYRTDGTVVQTSGPGTGSAWEGAAILPNGNWVTTRRIPSGVNIFDGTTGAEIATWDTPLTAVAGDVGVFSDGSIVIVEQSGTLWRFDMAGNLIASWRVPGSPFGVLVDPNDEVWTCDAIGGVLWHTDSLGQKLSEFRTGPFPGDVTMAADGSLFVTLSLSGEVAHFRQDGTLLGTFFATNKGVMSAIAVGEDQTLWVSAEQETRLLNFDRDGTPLGSFDVGPALRPLLLTIPITPGADIGANYCGPANSNSTGQPAVISAFGSTSAAKNAVVLTASQLPPNVFGYFLNSDVQGFVPLPPGSSGNLCLGGGIGRHTQQVASSGPGGALVIALDLTLLPRPGGGQSVLAGETWNFQCWFRDNQAGPTSNFTDGISILFD